jgi:thymidylate synthase
MNYYDNCYQDLLRFILDKGNERTDRTGTGTVGVFSPPQLYYDLTIGTIPLMTVKRMPLNSIIHELLWYIRGDSNIRYLTENNVHIWDAWADENGDLGPVYGHQWRRLECWKPVRYDESSEIVHPSYAQYSYDGRFIRHEIDQLQNVIDTIKTNPTDRRMIVNSWNVGYLEDMNLPPCHYTYQFYVNMKTNALDLKLTQRSADMFLGVPFNIVQYSMLLCMVAHITGLERGQFIWSGGDVHIYKDHMEAVNTVLNRAPHPAPTLKFTRKIDNINDFEFDDFVIEGYKYHPAVKAPVSV